MHFDSLATLPLLRAASQLSGTRYAAAVPRVRLGDLPHGDAGDLPYGYLPHGDLQHGDLPQLATQQRLKLGALEAALAEARAELAVARDGRRVDAVPPAVPCRTSARTIESGPLGTLGDI